MLSTSLFFIRLNFTVIYHPSSKNSEADALFCCQGPVDKPVTPKPILSPFIFIAIQHTQVNKTTPLGCPPSKQNVPSMDTPPPWAQLTASLKRGSPHAGSQPRCLWAIFRDYSMPVDILSGWGPQFPSRVWQAFCEGLGVNVSLTSGYIPWLNGQAGCDNQELACFLQTYYS